MTTLYDKEDGEARREFTMTRQEARAMVDQIFEIAKAKAAEKTREKEKTHEDHG